MADDLCARNVIVFHNWTVMRNTNGTQRYKKDNVFCTNPGISLQITPNSDSFNLC